MTFTKSSDVFSDIH